jgi:hypothetical protein
VLPFDKEYEQLFSQIVEQTAETSNLLASSLVRAPTPDQENMSLNLLCGLGAITVKDPCWVRSFHKLYPQSKISKVLTWPLCYYPLALRAFTEMSGKRAPSITQAIIFSCCSLFRENGLRSEKSQLLPYFICLRCLVLICFKGRGRFDRDSVYKHTEKVIYG